MADIIQMNKYLEDKPEDELTVAEYARLHPNIMEEIFERENERAEGDKRREKIIALEDELNSLGDTEFEEKRKEKIIKEIFKTLGPIQLEI